MHVNDEDRCYVYDFERPHQPGNPPVFWLDCPSELRDPAWRHCQWG